MNSPSIDVDRIHFANAKKLDTGTANIFVLENFMTGEDCEAMVKQIQGKLAEPEEIDPANIKLKMAQAQNKALDRRIIRYLGVADLPSDRIRAQCFSADQAIAPAEDDTAALADNEKGRPSWLFLVFLNDVESGGETCFEQLDVSIKPKAGTAVFWSLLNEDGSPNQRALHTEKALAAGEKYTLIKRIRTRSEGPVTLSPYLHRRIKTFTELGFEKARIPDELFAKITDFYRQNKKEEQKETDAAVGTFIKASKKKHPASVVHLPMSLKHSIYDTLIPVFEQWSGLKLQQTLIYGIRSYKKGAHLKMHVDRYQTHLVSAIVNVDQSIERKWPLYAYDHYGNIHEVFLEPGEMVFYESATVAHGRPIPLNGKNFSNIFIHTMPVGWESKEKELTQMLRNGEVVQQDEFEHTV